MNKTKFRGRKDNGEWRYGDFITDNKEFHRTCNGAYILPHWEKMNSPIAVEKKTVGQYTGLKCYTKNDDDIVEMYDGDIVLYKDVKFFIQYDIGSFLLVKCDDDTDIYELFEDCWNDNVYPLSQLYWNSDCEENFVDVLNLIGNIHDNPELIN